MLSSLKIGPKLIIGFLSVALLVGFVGVLGITSTTTIQKNNEVETDIRDIMELLDDLLRGFLQLIETQNLDDYSGIKSSVETTRKEFDVLHKKVELIHNIREFEGFDKDIEEFTTISNGIIAIHKEKLVQKREFDKRAVLERDLRRKIRTPLFALHDAAVTEAIGSMQYKSKEALYQYGDQKHVNEWLESIEKVKSNVENPNLLQDVISYRLLSQGMGEIVIAQKEAEAKELVRVEQLRGAIDKLEDAEDKVIAAFDLESESLRNNTRLTLLIAVVVAFVISIVLGSYISSSISKPIANLSQTARSIAGGDLNKRVEVTSKDEIGQLARTFNEMAAKLKESYEGLEGKVNERTQELKNEKDKVVAIVQGISDGVFAIDTNYRITMFNQAAATISGFGAEKAVGQKYDTILKFVLEEDGKTNDAFIREAIHMGIGKEMTNHTVLIRKNGRRVVVANSASPLKDENNNVVGCVVVFRDVTKEREIDRAKSEFVSLAAHQLRTPLSTINWYAEMLLEGDVDKSKESRRKYLDKIYQNNQRMVGLVNALLNASRIELGILEVKPKPTNLTEIADGVLEEFSLQVKNKELQIKKHYAKNLPTMNIDPDLMQIVFRNLLSNAIQYTFDGGTISFAIGKKKSNAFITVSDNGAGIPEDQQSKIFTKLFRADNAVATYANGTGLSLYITKSIVEKFGGKIWFESEENKGTTFYVTIPLIFLVKKMN